MHKAMVLVLTQDSNAAKTAASGAQSSNGGKYGAPVSHISQASPCMVIIITLHHRVVFIL